MPQYSYVHLHIHYALIGRCRALDARSLYQKLKYSAEQTFATFLTEIAASEPQIHGVNAIEELCFDVTLTLP